MFRSSSVLLPSTLILGGARSGKSRFAESLFAGTAMPIYIATAEAGDDEMRARIADHRAQRPNRWRTIEEPLDLVGALARAEQAGSAILVDCITLWIANLLGRGGDPGADFERLVEALPRLGVPAVLVANEVGYGIVPDNALARAFRDHAGALNQRLAGCCQRVVLVTAGLPLVLKDIAGGSRRTRRAPALMEE